MKGFMALEYPFKVLLYLVVVVVVIGIILTFRKELSSMNFCWVWGCKPEACKTIRANENIIDEQVLDKYCNLCWQKTGSISLNEDCVCYILNGTFTPTSYSSENCELKCTSASQFVTFTYSHLFNKIYIEC